MKTVGELLSRDLKREINEIIKVDQIDEQIVYDELVEYVVTPPMKDQYRALFKAYAESRSEPTESAGIWISGFFGSGKSSFAKNFGYVLANRTVLGHQASELFKERLGDKATAQYIDVINTSIPTEVVMLDVTTLSGIKDSNEKVSYILYRALLKQLGYAEDPLLARLEMELEEDGQLDDFMSACSKRFNREWRIVRKMAQNWNMTSAILHEMDPATYPNTESWSKTVLAKSRPVTLAEFIDQTFRALMARRPDHGLVFIVDEVGQYIAHSDDKIEDLRAIVEQFGKESRNRLKKHEIKAPVWVIVTSQERLDEVVAGIDSKKVELARLQERFPKDLRVDLKPSDIREVASSRILAKTPAGESELKKLYDSVQGRLSAAVHLENAAQLDTSIDQSSFVRFYPYLPFFMDLSIDIMSGIRLQPGMPRQIGGSNRTIIKQVYEMLVSPRTRFADKQVGSLVTLDAVYRLVEESLPSDQAEDVRRTVSQLNRKGDSGAMATRVLQTVCLLAYVAHLPRTEGNIAACLVSDVEAAAPVAEVRETLELLKGMNIIRNTDEGWRLQSRTEETWQQERHNLGNPKSADRNELLRTAVNEICGDTPLRQYRHASGRTFAIEYSLDGTTVVSGKVPVSLLSVDGSDQLAVTVADAVTKSRQMDHGKDVFWAFVWNSDVDACIEDVFRSKQMVAKYDMKAASGKLTPEFASCLTAEKNAVSKSQIVLRDKVRASLEQGVGVFAGVQHDASELGKNLVEQLHGLLGIAVPAVYSKLAMGACGVKGTEASEVLKSTNLEGLSNVFYSTDKGLGLVRRQDGHNQVALDAPVAAEVLNFIKAAFDQTGKEACLGKALEEHFGEPPYGWEGDVLRIVLASLVRAGAVEPTVQGQRCASYKDPRCLTAFGSLPAFKVALFLPCEMVSMALIRDAAVAYVALTGSSELELKVDVVAGTIRNWATGELATLVDPEMRMKYAKLPGAEVVQEYHDAIAQFQDLSDVDCIKLMAANGTELKAATHKAHPIVKGADENAAKVMDNTGKVMADQLQALQRRGNDGDLDEIAQELTMLTASTVFYAKMSRVQELIGQVTKRYAAAYQDLHQHREKVYREALSRLQSFDGWTQLKAPQQVSISADLTKYMCSAPLDGVTGCEQCHATLDGMASDIDAVQKRLQDARAAMDRLLNPTDDIVVLHVSAYLSATFSEPEALQQALNRLQQDALKAIAEGKKVRLE